MTQDSDNDWIIRNTTMGFVFNESKLSTTYYNATQFNSVVGTVQGVLASTNHKDGNYDGITWNLTEESGSPGLDVRINFTNGITDFTQGIMRYKAPTVFGSGPTIQLWNYDELVWEDYDTIIESPIFTTIERGIFDGSDHVSGGVVQMRLYKATSGNTNNKYQIDWLAIAKGYGTPAGEENDPFAIHRDGTSTVTANIDFASYNLTTTGWFKGLFNWTVTSIYATFNGALLTINDALLNTNFNQTQLILDNNDSWLSTYNLSYAGSLNNDSYLSTYNATYAGSTGDNASWNQTGADLLYAPISVTSSTYNASYDAKNTSRWNLVGSNIHFTTGDVNISKTINLNVTCYGDGCAVCTYYNGSSLISEKPCTV